MKRRKTSLNPIPPSNYNWPSQGDTFVAVSKVTELLLIGKELLTRLIICNFVKICLSIFRFDVSDKLGSVLSLNCSFITFFFAHFIAAASICLA